MTRNTGARVPIYGGVPSRRKIKDIVSVGTVIKDILKKKDMSITTLCKKADVKSYILSKIVNNVRKIDSETAKKIEEVLELTPQYLMNADKRFRDFVSKQIQVAQEVYDDEDEYDGSMERTKPTFKSEREIELEYKNFHRSMKDYISNFMAGNLKYVLISLSDTYAVIAKVVNLEIKKYVETMFQSLDRCVSKDFAVLTIFEWGRGLPDDSPLNNIECAIQKLYTTEEVEKRLNEIGSV